jgi:hypothetical protein
MFMRLSGIDLGRGVLHTAPETKGPVMSPIPRSWSALAAVLLLAVPALAGPIRSGFTDNPIPGNDDASLGPVSLGFNVNFFGTTYSSLYVNTNGNLTFDGALQGFSPFGLTSTGKQIIAPFFADVDTTAGNLVTWGTGSVDGHNTFAVTWPGVGFYPSRTNLTNDFQAVLIDRSDTGAGNFDMEFNYGQIQWETGGSSGGVDGLGGASARVGYSDGSGNPGSAFELPGSAVNGAFLDTGPLDTALISNKLNSDQDGRYVFQGRNGSILIPQLQSEPGDATGTATGGASHPGESPEPGSLLLAGTGLLLLTGYVARRCRRIRILTRPAAPRSERLTAPADRAEITTGMLFISDNPA